MAVSPAAKLSGDVVMVKMKPIARFPTTFTKSVLGFWRTILFEWWKGIAFANGAAATKTIRCRFPFEALSLLRGSPSAALSFCSF